MTKKRRDREDECTPSSSLQTGQHRDWRTELEEARQAEQEELRSSERNDGFRGRTIRRARLLQDLLRWPNETPVIDPDAPTEVTDYLKRMEDQRQLRLRRQGRIETVEPLVNWVARRLVRIARSFRLWLEATKRPYVPFVGVGFWAEQAARLVDSANSADSLRLAERELRGHLVDVFSGPGWWLLDGREGTDGGLVPQYLVSDAVWRDLFRANERAGELGSRSASPGGGADGEGDLPVLGKQEQEFMEIFLDREPFQALSGPEACDEFQRRMGGETAIDESAFRSRIVPRLRHWGLQNEPRRGYFFPADSPARRMRRA